jgi:hypothetical protein
MTSASSERGTNIRERFSRPMSYSKLLFSLFLFVAPTCEAQRFPCLKSARMAQ